MSKLRPSIPIPDGVINGHRALRRRPHVFRNFYTRAGRRFLTSGWVVKLQHRGERRTFSLRAKTKAAAMIEAKAIGDTLMAEGWEAILRQYSHPAANRSAQSEGVDWRERLLVRRYGFPASNAPEGSLAVRIDHAGTGCWFPLGTVDPDLGAAKAQRIYETVVKLGWEECSRRFPRELMVGFEWSSNPLLWTYATIHTMVEEKFFLRSRRSNAAHRVLITERDSGVGRALEWSLRQQSGIQSAVCDSVESFDTIFNTFKPHLVLLNRNLAERLGFGSPGQLASINGKVPALTYSLAVDGDQLFVSTPGGAEGYALKRIKPDCLLEPIFRGNFGSANLSAEELLLRVRSYFKELLQPRSSQAASGVKRLTRRENEVLGLLSKGCVDKEIAQALGISAWTVHGHIKSIFERLQVRTRTEAVVRYLEK